MAKRASTKIHYGDILHLFVFNQPEITGDFQVQDDGYLYVPKTDGVEVLNLTVNEAQRKVKQALAERFKSPIITLSLRLQAEQKIYVVGGSRPKGTVTLTPTTDLRKVVAEAGNDKSDADLVDISVFRQGVLIQRLSEQALIQDSKTWSGPLEANDVVVLQPTPLIRVWVSGQVKLPGRIPIPVGSDVYQALAAAGDVVSDGSFVRDQMLITVRRGTQEIPVPANPGQGISPVKMEAGDTILVQPPLRKHIYVSGEVKAPNDYVLSASGTVFEAINKAGGLTGDGSFGSVYVLHNGRFRYFKGDPLDQRGILAQEVLAPEDSVLVPLNNRIIFVLGEVKNPGRYEMEDSRTYRLAEVLARAGGLGTDGTLRRAVIVRYSSDGHAKSKLYNLDEFLKDGKSEANPEVRSGDFIFFGKPKGVNVSDVANGLSSVLLLATLLQKI